MAASNPGTLNGHRTHVAIDLGAGSGRAFVGRVEADRLHLSEVHRFHYAPRPSAGHLRWDMTRLLEGLGEGVGRGHATARAAGAIVDSIGVDTWGVDYGLVDAEGRLVEEPCSYRDARTDGIMDAVLEQLPRETIFAATGLQFLPFNTIYQLVAHVREGLPPNAARLLMMPDLCHHWLCGSVCSEETNASTTQLLDARTRRWAGELLAALGLPSRLMPELVGAGTEIGRLRPERQAALGVDAVPVVAPATHDTGSAVAGIPLQDGWAYISSGTWSLVGVELASALLDARVAAANFTNEAGVGGSVRFLKNVMGLWILESCRREWQAAGETLELAELLERAGALAAPAGYIYPDAARFLHPTSMTAEIRASLIETGQQPLDDPVQITRVVLDSLACRYASVIDAIETLTGRPIAGIHVVGGGSRNEWLNQATADATGRPVLAGPVEATATGNIIVQAMAMGTLASLAEARRLVARSVSLQRFEPRDTQRWRERRRRYEEIVGGTNA